MRGKKGAELTMNVIIVTIIVIIVLVIVAAFFIFGFSGLSNRIKTIFGVSTSGSDYNLVVAQCENLCEQAKELSSTQKSLSPFCLKKFDVDLDSNGELNSKEKDLTCSGAKSVGVSCPEVTC